MFSNILLSWQFSVVYLCICIYNTTVKLAWDLPRSTHTCWDAGCPAPGRPSSPASAASWPGWRSQPAGRWESWPSWRWGTQPACHRDKHCHVQEGAGDRPQDPNTRTDQGPGPLRREASSPWGGVEAGPAEGVAVGEETAEGRGQGGATGAATVILWHTMRALMSYRLYAQSLGFKYVQQLA